MIHFGSTVTIYRGAGDPTDFVQRRTLTSPLKLVMNDVPDKTRAWETRGLFAKRMERSEVSKVVGLDHLKTSSLMVTSRSQLFSMGTTDI